MNKRSILFILLITATFFGLNLFFSHQRDKKQRQLLLQKEAQEKEKALKLREEYAGHEVKVAELPLVTLTADEAGKERLGQGVDINGNVLTLAWSEKLPKQVYVKGKLLTLLTKEITEQAPILYSTPDFTHFDIAALPEKEAFDVQVVTFPSGRTPEAYLGIYQHGSLIFPLSTPEENGLALYKNSQGYLPLGLYIAQGKIFVELQNLPSLSDVIMPAGHEEVSPPKEQQFYLLENSYVQLVFSNVGGALAEINLLLKSKEHEKSVINEIGFDREIAKSSPENARFPAHPYHLPGSPEEKPPGPVGGYYPLLRRGITNEKTAAIPPEYYAFNIVSDYPEMAQLIYEVKSFTKESIVFQAVQPHRKITKTFTLSQADLTAPYCLNLKIQIDGDSRGLWLTSGVPEVEIMSNTSTPQIQYRYFRKDKGVVEKLKLPKAGEVINVSSLHPDWIVNSNGYLGVILDPLTEIGPGYRAVYISGALVPTRLTVIDPRYKLYPAAKYPGYQTLLPLPTLPGSTDFRFYTGPFEEATLTAVDNAFKDPTVGYNPDYIACRTFYGWFAFISKPFAKVLFVVMKFFHMLSSSWGLAIILLTVFLRILLYPLNGWSIKSMRRMQLISPQVQAIQKKYKKDPKKAQIEIMTLYREKRVNPFMGCVPILIQIPFLIAMFDLLKSSFQLRGASFIPGWIDNLTAPDILFQWKQPLFFIGNGLHLLPILLGVVMFIQQRFSSPAPKDPSQLTDQQRQQRAMGTIMTLFFMVMFYHFPSGLNLYWLSSMVLGIGQQWFTNKLLDRKKGKVELLPAKKK